MISSRILFSLKNNKLLNTLSEPAKAIVRKMIERQTRRHPLRRANLLHKSYYGTPLDLDTPKTLYDKIILLEIGSDISEWQRLTDKVSARDFVKERGMEHLLNKTYHVLDAMPTFEDFTAMLPDRCVVKTNNSGGSEAVHIIRDKAVTDLKKVYKRLQHNFNDDYGIRTGQPHYQGIKPKIIIERLIENDENPEAPINDYKFMCINGEPQVINVIAERNIKTHQCLDQYYYLDFTRIDWEPQNHQRHIRKPDCLEEMVEAARILAKGFPFVRVDFYESHGKPIFSEMTFTPGYDFFLCTVAEEKLHWGEIMDISGVKIDRSKISPDLY